MYNNYYLYFICRRYKVREAAAAVTKVMHGVTGGRATDRPDDKHGGGGGGGKHTREQRCSSPGRA